MPSWYLEWVSKYLVANEANTAPNQAMLKTWWRGFDAMRATAAELDRSIFDVLALNSRPIRMADHFSLIRAEIVRRRSEAAKTAIANYSEKDLGQCVLCGGSGTVSVPHHRFATGERWRPYYSTGKKEIFPTVGVVCSCDAGRRIVACQQSNEDHKKQMTLDHYENFVNGNWREQLAEQRERNRAIIETENMASWHGAA